MNDLDQVLTELEEDALYEGNRLGQEEKWEYEYEYEDDTLGAEGPFDEGEEMELASELLDVKNDQELDQFLGKLIKRASRKVRRFMKSSTGRRLRGYLRNAAKIALPLAGRAVGTYFGGPIGGTVGSQVGSLAGNIFGLELEGLSPEDMEFEVARRFVRFAGTTVQNTALMPETTDPAKVVRKAAASAARLHAPGFMRDFKGLAASGVRSGRWVRRGNRIILLGI